MKKRIQLTIASIGLIALSAWTIKQANDIKKAEWLIGTWENKTARGSSYEAWTKTSPNEFSGRSYMIKEKDTVVFENILLAKEKSGLFYIPVVKNQNGGLPVRFAAKSISDTEMIFENLQYDFPQRISYKKVGKDSLVAEISGSMNGKERKQVFPMRKLK